VAAMRRLALFLPIALSLSCAPVTAFRYETVHRVRVYSENRVVSQERVEDWTREAFSMWEFYRPRWKDCISMITRHGLRVRLTLTDPSVVTCKCGPGGSAIDASGYTDRRMNITMADTGYDKQVLVHEIGHVLAWACEGLWDKSHEMFREIGFPWM
jgi:hypothetical protein